MFEVGQRVIVKPTAYTRAGETGEIVIVYEQNAVVRFADGYELAYLLDDDEIEAAPAAHS